jgi:hypothetical protein
MASALDTITQMFSPDALRSGAMDIAQYVIWGIVILGAGLFGWKKWQDKKIYIYPVRIFRRRTNGIVKEFNTFGGYIVRNGITHFNVKMTKFKKKNMDKLPNSEYMDEDNRVYYWQVSPDAPYIQVKRDFKIEQIVVPDDKFVEPTQEQRKVIIEKLKEDLSSTDEFKEVGKEKIQQEAEKIYEIQLEQEKLKVIDITQPTYTPVPSDLKQQAMAEINNYKNMLGVDVNKQMAYFVGGLIILGIVAVILFYIAMNKGAIPILTE